MTKLPIMENLISLYESFFQNLQNTNKVMKDSGVPATTDELDALESDFNLFLSDDLREFLSSPKNVYYMRSVEGGHLIGKLDLILLV